ncbi:MAG: host attachment protein [Kofleriaceae bacterium]|nr:host attachment protein [Kofleriaceae bacterium]
MKRACIAVVDALRARLYTYEEGGDPTHQLSEKQDLVNAGRRLKVGDMVSNNEPGMDVSPGGARARSQTDDHRDAKVEEMDSKFAREIVENIERLVNEDGFRHLIVVASPKMLGLMRQADGVLHRPDLTIDEISRDLAKLTSSQLHDHLASMKLIPARVRLATARAR